jgi:hypothetical protein
MSCITHERNRGNVLPQIRQFKFERLVIVNFLNLFSQLVICCFKIKCGLLRAYILGQV